MSLPAGVYNVQYLQNGEVVALGTLDLEGGGGEPTGTLTLRDGGTHMQWSNDDGATWNDLKAWSELTGPAPQMRTNNSNVEWKHEDTTTWEVLFPVPTSGGSGSGSGSTHDVIYVKDYIPDYPDHAAAIQAAFDAQKAADTSINHSVGGYMGTSPIVDFSGGTYQIDRPITIKTHYPRIRGEGAVLMASSSYAGDSTGNHCLRASGNAWRVSIEGLQFAGFPTPIYLNSNNLNSGIITISGCSFFGASEYAMRIRAQSSYVQLNNNLFRHNKHELYVEAADLIHITGGWINRGHYSLTSDQDAGIINYGHMVMENVLGAYDQQTVSEDAWVNNHAYFRAKNCRFGGEDAGTTVVNNFSKWDRNKSHKACVILENNETFSGSNDKTAVRLFEIPSQLSLINNSGFPGQRYVNWAAGISSSEQSTKINAISATDLTRREAGMYFLGNCSAYGSQSGSQLPLVPTNLHHLIHSHDGTPT